MKTQALKKTLKKTLPSRIKTRKYFLLAAHNGRKFVAKGMIVQIISNGKPNEMRVGFTTTKKLGGAVIRNRVRRRLREVCRLEFATAPKGYDYVFIGRIATIERPFIGLQKDARYILAQFKSGLQKKTDRPCEAETPQSNTDTCAENTGRAGGDGFVDFARNQVPAEG